MASIFQSRLRKLFAATGFGVRPAETTRDSSVPLIKAASGAASATDPNGSIHMRTDGLPEYRIGGAWAELVVADNALSGSVRPKVITDPGDAGAIPVTDSGSCAMTSAGAETRTLAIPTFEGQRLTLFCDTYVGDIVVTASAAVNVANNNTLTFGAASEACELVGVTVGGSLVWQVGWNDGVGLTTV